MRTRLDVYLSGSPDIFSRSQAENYIKLGKVKVNGRVISKPAFLVGPSDKITVEPDNRYVSRAGNKLASVAERLDINFKDKVVLDVGSSTGGFTDYALKNKAKRVFAVDVGTDQLHPSLRQNPLVELMEKTDIRHVKKLDETPQIVVIDVSFISLREILQYLPALIGKDTEIIALAKPQFESQLNSQKNKGVIKNENIRRDILAELENWLKTRYFIADKADSEVKGEKGNRERFYKLFLLGA